MKYNREQIDKNVRMIVKCTNDCLAELNSGDGQVLRDRMELTINLARLGLKTLKDLPQDNYLVRQIYAVEDCINRWEAYKNGR